MAQSMPRPQSSWESVARHGNCCSPMGSNHPIGHLICQNLSNFAKKNWQWYQDPDVHSWHRHIPEGDSSKNWPKRENAARNCVTKNILQVQILDLVYKSNGKNLSKFQLKLKHFKMWKSWSVNICWWNLLKLGTNTAGRNVDFHCSFLLFQLLLCLNIVLIKDLIARC